MPMSDRDRVDYESLKRCTQIPPAWASYIPLGTLFASGFTDLNVAVADLEAAAGVLDAAKGEASAQVDIKTINRGEVTDQLDSVVNAARAAEPAHHGYQARFRYDRDLSGIELLAVIDSFLTADAVEQGVLSDLGASATWHADLTSARTLWNDTINQSAAAKGSRVAAKADFDEKMRIAKQIKKTQGHQVPNYFGSSAAAIAAWATAAHVEKLPVIHRTPPTP